MNYAEAVEYLFKLQRVGTTLGLERTLGLAELAGRPQDSLRFIHVAGTNGKGSTCAMLESIYRHAGYRVGLFTSPHLISFAERIQVDRKLIPEADVARLTVEMRELAARLPAGTALTLFEVVTVMALRWFVEQKCEVVIWETGLGGRLDATNIVTPLASVITNIQRDHENWLGHTLAEIAREKAGIIKQGIPVFTAATEPEALAVIGEVAKEKGALFHRIAEPTEPLATSLIGPHQLFNATLALGVALSLHGILPIKLNAHHALRTVYWPGRFDIRGRYILDGAHNPAGAATLRMALEQTFPGVKPTFIVGVLADKDIEGMAREIVPVASRVLTVAVQSERAADAETIAARFRTVAPELQIEACVSLASALEESELADRVVITGSLHFIGEAMEHLHLEVGRGEERSLNDWSGRVPGR